MTMKSFRISCYILFLFPFILEDAAVTAPGHMLLMMPATL